MRDSMVGAVASRQPRRMIEQQAKKRKHTEEQDKEQNTDEGSEIMKEVEVAVIPAGERSDFGSADLGTETCADSPKKYRSTQSIGKYYAGLSTEASVAASAQGRQHSAVQPSGVGSRRPEVMGFLEEQAESGVRKDQVNTDE